MLFPGRCAQVQTSDASAAAPILQLPSLSIRELLKIDVNSWDIGLGYLSFRLRSEAGIDQICEAQAFLH